MHTFIDLTAGTVGGCTGIVVGQPLDTVKVRIQALPGVYAGPVECFFRTLRQEGVLALFKGVVAPVIGNAPMNGLIFGGYGARMRALDATLGPLPEDTNVSLSRVVAASSFSGFVQTVIATPVELVKCRLQVQNTSTGPPVYSGAWNVLTRQVKLHGFWRGTQQGFVATSLRDCPGFGAYFLVFEWVKDLLTPAGGTASVGAILVAGGLGGQAGWGLTFPCDVLKSRIQTLPDTAPAEHRKLMYQARQVYRTAGIRGFFSGLGATLIRAFPVNAVTFLVYEKTSDALKARLLGDDEDDGSTHACE